MVDYLSLLPPLAAFREKEAYEKTVRVVLAIEGATDMTAAQKVGARISQAKETIPADSSLQSAYEVLLARLQFVRLPLLADNELRELFNTHLADLLLEEDVNCTERFERAILFLMEPLTAQKLTDLVFDALVNCVSPLGSATLQVGEGKEPATVSAWIRLLHHRLPETHKPRQVDIVQFLTTQAEVRSLANEEREAVKRLIRFYLYVRFPDDYFRPEFLMHEYDERDYATLPAALPAIAEVKGNALTAAAQWQETHKAELNQIYEQEGSVLGEIQEKHEKVRDVLWDSAEQGNRIKSIAALKMLAKMGALHEIFTRPDVVTTFTPYVTRRFGEGAGVSFAKNPNRPQYVTALIRYVLEEKLESSETESPLWALPVLRLLQTQNPIYAKAVYFDEGSGNFKWNSDMSVVLTTE